MEYRYLRDGSRISTTGIGVGNYAFEHVAPAEIERIFATAFDGGINYFDTCLSAAWPAEPMARAIKNIPRHELIMQNHLCRDYRSGERVRTRKLADVKDAFTFELKKYGTDYSDIGIIYFVDEEKDIRQMVDFGIVDHALSLRKEGIIRNLGFSSHTVEVARKMLDVADFDVLFFGVNAGFDLQPYGNTLTVSEARKDLYATCSKRGIAITAMKPYNNGRLLDAKRSPFGRAMTTHQCLQYALDRPAVVSCLCGATTAEEMKKTLQFYEASAEERDYSYLGLLSKKDLNIGCTYCNHCVPCPVHINVGQVNKYYDLAKVGDLIAAEHYDSLSKHASDCIHCGGCNSRCPFHVDMSFHMNEIRDFFQY